MGGSSTKDGNALGAAYTRIADEGWWPTYHPSDPIKVGTFLTRVGGYPHPVRRPKPIEVALRERDTPFRGGTFTTKGTWTWSPKTQAQASMPLVFEGKAGLRGSWSRRRAAILRIGTGKVLEAENLDTLLHEALQAVTRTKLINPNLLVVPSVVILDDEGFAAVYMKKGGTFGLRLGGQGDALLSAGAGLPPVEASGVGEIDYATTSGAAKIWDLGHGYTPVYGQPYGFRESVLKELFGPDRYFIYDHDHKKPIGLSVLQKRAAESQMIERQQTELEHEGVSVELDLPYDPTTARLSSQELLSMPVREVFEPISDERMHQVFVPWATVPPRITPAHVVPWVIAGVTVAGVLRRWFRSEGPGGIRH